MRLYMEAHLRRAKPAKKKKKRRPVKRAQPMLSDPGWLEAPPLRGGATVRLSRTAGAARAATTSRAPAWTKRRPKSAPHGVVAAGHCRRAALLNALVTVPGICPADRVEQGPEEAAKRARRLERCLDQQITLREAFRSSLKDFIARHGDLKLRAIERRDRTRRHRAAGCQEDSATPRLAACLLDLISLLRGATLDTVELEREWTSAGGSTYRWRGVAYLSRVRGDCNFLAQVDGLADLLGGIGLADNPLYLLADGGRGAGGAGVTYLDALQGGRPAAPRLQAAAAYLDRRAPDADAGTGDRPADAEAAAPPPRPDPTAPQAPDAPGDGFLRTHSAPAGLFDRGRAPSPPRTASPGDGEQRGGREEELRALAASAQHAAALRRLKSAMGRWSALTRSISTDLQPPRMTTSVLPPSPLTIRARRVRHVLISRALRQRFGCWLREARLGALDRRVAERYKRKVMRCALQEWRESAAAKALALRAKERLLQGRRRSAFAATLRAALTLRRCFEKWAGFHRVTKRFAYHGTTGWRLRMLRAACAHWSDAIASPRGVRQAAQAKESTAACAEDVAAGSPRPSTDSRPRLLPSIPTPRSGSDAEEHCSARSAMFDVQENGEDGENGDGRLAVEKDEEGDGRLVIEDGDGYLAVDAEDTEVAEDGPLALEASAADDGGEAWAKYEDPATNVEYFYNDTTGASTWRRPAGFQTARSAAAVDALGTNAAVQGMGGAEARAGADEALGTIASICEAVGRGTGEAKDAPCLSDDPSAAVARAASSDGETGGMHDEAATQEGTPSMARRKGLSSPRQAALESGEARAADDARCLAAADAVDRNVASEGVDQGHHAHGEARRGADDTVPRDNDDEDEDEKGGARPQPQPQPQPQSPRSSEERTPSPVPFQDQALASWALQSSESPQPSYPSCDAPGHGEGPRITVWEEHQDMDGHVYFYDPATGESTWEAHGWIRRFDEHGTTYYYDTVTGGSSWHPPHAQAGRGTTDGPGSGAVPDATEAPGWAEPGDVPHQSGALFPSATEGTPDGSANVSTAKAVVPRLGTSAEMEQIQQDSLGSQRKQRAMEQGET